LVESLPAGATAWDSEVRGFGVRRQRRNAVYIVKFRDAAGRQRLITIGRHGPGEWSADRARREAIKIRGMVVAGQDPAADRDQAKNAPTFAEFSARYMAEYAEAQKKPRTLVEDRRLLKQRIMPVLGTIKLREITRSDVARFQAGMRATPVAANRATALLSAILGWAERVGERQDGTNPCRHVDRYPEKARERLLTAPELARLGDALDRAAEPWTDAGKATWRDECQAQAKALGIPEPRISGWAAGRMPVRDTAEDWRAVAAFRLLAFTGARLSEILTLRLDWIDAPSGVARLPDSKTGAKNLYLPPGALAVLETLPRFASNPHVLPGDRAGSHFVGVQKPWQRIRALAALPDVRIHDLRHAFASTAVAAGDSLFIVGKLLGHRQASTTERYSHLAPDPALAAATRTAERLAGLMSANKQTIGAEDE
jgi:integrase